MTDVQVTNTNTNERKLNRGGLTHVPSPRWTGALASAVLLAATVTLFSYTLLDWDWQQHQGNRNWYALIIELLVFARILRSWRNDPRRTFAGEG